jgi:hypothetical protein
METDMRSYLAAAFHERGYRPTHKEIAVARNRVSQRTGLAAYGNDRACARRIPRSVVIRKVVPGRVRSERSHVRPAN